MSRGRILAASGIFLLITVVKLAFPSLAAEIRSVVLPVIDRQDDYRTAMVEVGEMITGERGVIAVLGRIYDKVVPVSGGGTGSVAYDSAAVKASASAEPLELTTLATIRSDIRTRLPRDRRSIEVPATEAPAAASEPPAAASEPPEPQPAEETEPVQPYVVTAFLESQSVYTDKEIPDGVMVKKPELPFDFTAPVAGYNSSGFGYRMHPIEQEVKFHYGTDFAADTGTDVLAFASGEVLVADEMDSYGRYIVIDHGGGYRTLYAHCSELIVKSGDYAKASQLIARVGESGQATGPHLHFELLSDGLYLNPEFYFAD